MYFEDSSTTEYGNIFSVTTKPTLHIHTRVIQFRRVCSKLPSKGRHWVVTWRTTGGEWVTGLGDSRGESCLGVVTLTERLMAAWD
jgi:hypothetical protein